MLLGSHLDPFLDEALVVDVLRIAHVPADELGMRAMGQPRAVELIDDNVTIAIDEFVVLSGKGSIGLFRPLLLDEGYSFLDHRHRVILARSVPGRGSPDKKRGCKSGNQRLL